jgi:TMEM175 potassium channel family protein
VGRSPSLSGRCVRRRGWYKLGDEDRVEEGAPITAGGQESDTLRIEVFSDGVFAIAITLLIIEIGVPHVGEHGSLLDELARLWPSYLGYAISFLIIGIVWANHHNRLRLISRSDRLFLVINILVLMCVAFIPFPTALLSEYIRDEAHRTTAVAVYSGTLAVTAASFTLLWLYAATNYRLVDRRVDPSLLGAMTRRYMLGMVLYTLAFVLSFLSPVASLTLIVFLALLFTLPEPDGWRATRRRSAGG